MDQYFNSLSASNENILLINTSKTISFLSDIAPIAIFSVIISFLLFIKKMKKDSILFIFTIGLTAFIELLFKYIIKRARPENALINETTFSFPSGHAIIAVVFFGLLIYILAKNINSKKARIITSFICIMSIFLIAISRIILNVHWFSDILGAFFLGEFILFLLLWINGLSNKVI